MLNIQRSTAVLMFFESKHLLLCVVEFITITPLLLRCTYVEEIVLVKLHETLTTSVMWTLPCNDVMTIDQTI